MGGCSFTKYKEFQMEFSQSKQGHFIKTDTKAIADFSRAGIQSFAHFISDKFNDHSQYI